MVSGGRSGPTLGPEAVTNSGDGNFVSGSGGSGGFKMDPCATVSGGCGGPDGGSGPGPAGPPERN